MNKITIIGLLLMVPLFLSLTAAFFYFLFKAMCISTYSLVGCIIVILFGVGLFLVMIGNS